MYRLYIYNLTGCLGLSQSAFVLQLFTLTQS